MKKKWFISGLMLFVFAFLTGCERLAVLDPKGPQAQTQADVILLSMGIMVFIVVVVFAILIYMLVKYRASKQPDDYKPPHIEGNIWVEAICVGIPVIIVAFLSVVSVQSNYA